MNSALHDRISVLGVQAPSGISTGFQRTSWPFCRGFGVCHGLIRGQAGGNMAGNSQLRNLTRAVGDGAPLGCPATYTQTHPLPQTPPGPLVPRGVARPVVRCMHIGHNQVLATPPTPQRPSKPPPGTKAGSPREHPLSTSYPAWIPQSSSDSRIPSGTRERGTGRHASLFFYTPNNLNATYASPSSSPPPSPGSYKWSKSRVSIQRFRRNTHTSGKPLLSPDAQPDRPKHPPRRSQQVATPRYHPTAPCHNFVA